MSAGPDSVFWSKYWSSDRAASSFISGERFYPEALNAVWRSLFNTLPDGARILDLCAGNGAVSRLAVSCAHARGIGFKVTAIDKAAISPLKVLSDAEGLQGVEFHAKADVADTRLPAGSADCLVSQFGLEYSALERACGELARLAAPGAVLVACMHAAEGRLAHDARRAADDMGFMFDELNVFKLARAAARAPFRSADDAAQAVIRFRSAMEHMHARLQTGRCDIPFITHVYGVLRDTVIAAESTKPSVVRDKLSELEDAVRGHGARNALLVDAARTREDLELFSAELARAGFARTQLRPTMLGGEQIGWWVQSDYQGG